MKRGTAAKVILGKDTLMDVPAGIVHGTDVILGGKAGLLNDFGGLVLSNNLMIGKKVSRGTITTVTVRGVAPIILPDAIAGSLQAVKAFGGTEQSGTPTPDAPVDIVSNNGVLRIQGSATGTVTQAGTPTPTTPIYPVFYQKGNLVLRAVDDYADTYDATTQTITRKVGVKVLDGTEDWTASSSYAGSCYTIISGSLNNPNGIAVLCSHFENSVTLNTYARGKCTKQNAFNLWYGNNRTTAVADLKQFLADQYNAGTPVIVVYPLATPTTESFTPSAYADGTVETIEDTIGNTATAEMLLKVGNYQDEQEILSGAITRNIGVKVLDGTENFNFSASGNSCLFEQSVFPNILDLGVLICSHLEYSSRAPSVPDRPNKIFWGLSSGINKVFMGLVNSELDTEVKVRSYLADQYAAGTPVIIVFPLATPTTESVTGQTLQVAQGDNTLEITQASLNGLELEATYKSLVQLTIQEVEDANLNNNVEVTIS